MIRILLERLRQGHRTLRRPPGPADLPRRFRGRPAVEPSRAGRGGAAGGGADARALAAVCPTGAIATDPLRIDLGACLFCGVCEEVDSSGTIRYSNDPRMAAGSRAGLMVPGGEAERAAALRAEVRRLFGRSLRLRQVSAGGCNGCEAELTALGNVVFDWGRFGIQFVASPRHADGLVITGPVTHNMAAALRDTWEAVPSPRIVLAVGACAISGGPFAGADAVLNGVPPEIPVDLYVPGCPPHPLTILDGVLRLLGRLPPPV
jgi:Ni,Fe-hydrogenase III small subunit